MDASSAPNITVEFFAGNAIVPHQVADIFTRLNADLLQQPEENQSASFPHCLDESYLQFKNVSCADTSTGNFYFNVALRVHTFDADALLVISIFTRTTCFVV